MIQLSHNSGDIYNQLMLTGKSYMGNGHMRVVEAICECGNTTWIRFSSLKNENSKSCGCGISKAATEKGYRHGLSKHELYHTWENMIQRCYNKNSTGYKRYGGRGITVCVEWKNDAEAFIKWAIENGWRKGLTIERKNNNNGYRPENCKCDTREAQARNKITNHNIIAFGETKCATDWAKDVRCSITYQQIIYRIEIMGWSAEKAITTVSKKAQAA